MNKNNIRFPPYKRGMNTLFLARALVNVDRVYGIFHVTVKQTGKYFGGVKLSIKLFSPWKASTAQKIKLKFAKGSKTYTAKWFKVSSNGVMN